jgi:hypothetical protein
MSATMSLLEFYYATACKLYLGGMCLVPGPQKKKELLMGYHVLQTRKNFCTGYACIIESIPNRPAVPHIPCLVPGYQTFPR